MFATHEPAYPCSQPAGEAVAVDAGKMLNATGRGIDNMTSANHSVDVVPTGSGREAKSTL
jgi:hypothetical protein